MRGCWVLKGWRINVDFETPPYCLLWRQFVYSQIPSPSSFLTKSMKATIKDIVNQSKDLSSDDIDEVIKELKNLKIKKIPVPDEVSDDEDSGCRKHSTCEEYEWHPTKNSRHCGKCHHPGTND